MNLHPTCAPADASRPLMGANSPRYLRSILESFVLLAVAVMLLRTFAVEGYMISTGSMAPCLLGFHRRVVCPRCQFLFCRGTRYDVDDTILADGIAGSDEKELAMVEETVCPNCGLEDIDLTGVPRNQGDQLLVDKLAFQFRSPSRWEVVVFRHPQEPQHAYLKRVVGLPGESLRVVDGDLEVNHELQRKPLAVQRSMRITVYDNDFPPPGEPRGPRWRSMVADSCWKGVDRGFHYKQPSVDAHAPTKLEWLSYHHWVSRGGSHVTSVPLLAWPDDLPSPPYISATDAFCALHFDTERRLLTTTGVFPEHEAQKLAKTTENQEFRQAILQLAKRSHEGTITDSCGYNHPHAAATAYPVADLMLEATVRAASGAGELRFRMLDGWYAFDLVFDFEQRQMHLISDDTQTTLRSAPLPPALLKGPGVVEMSLFDRQVVIAVNGEEVFPALPYSASTRPRQPERHPVSIGAAGGDFVIDQLRLYRDVYYTPKGSAQADNIVRVPPHELFVLGDNSPVSVDSRIWKTATIPEKLLIGKPIVVHLPSRQERIEVGSAVRHIRIPDLSNIRYIR